MAIFIYCEKCYATFKKPLVEKGTKRCPKCKATLPSEAKRYRVVVRHKGRTKTALAPNRELAKEIETKFERELFKRTDLGEKEKKPMPRLDDVWAHYLDEYTGYGKPEAIRAERNRYSFYWQPLFGKKRLDTITTAAVAEVKTRLSKSLNKDGRLYRPKTVMHVVQLLSRLFEHAIRNELFEGTNPCRAVKLPKIQKTRPRYLTSEEMRRLLDTLDAWPDQSDANFVRALSCSGIRRGEGFKLEWRDVDFEREEMRLRDPKGGQDEYLPLNHATLTILRDQRNRVPCTPGSLVFPGKSGVKRTYFSHVWYAIREAAELPPDFKIHNLRSNFASMLASSGRCDIKMIQHLLTHKDGRVTARYAGLMPNAIKRGTQVFDSLLADVRRDPDGPENVVNLDEARRRKGA